MNTLAGVTRRNLLVRAGLGGLGLAAVSVLFRETVFAQSKAAQGGISPAEDLMTEHGLLRRVMLCFDEVSRFNNGADAPFEAIADSARLIVNFIQDYHEKLEEDHVFPIFEKAGRNVELIKTLRRQHEVGRAVVRNLLAAADRKKPEWATIVQAKDQFTRMYRPHAAWEDTVLFRALPQMVGEKEYDKLGDQFEDIEQEKFGKEGGFDGMLRKVQAIETAFGVGDLAKYTPKI